jgi:hypothetical protein
MDISLLAETLAAALAPALKSLMTLDGHRRAVGESLQGHGEQLPA